MPLGLSPPTTELDAVNTIIGTMGEGRVNTLEGDDNVDVLNARGLLVTVNAETQDMGWTFNVDETKLLQPDTFSRQIVWLPTYLRLWVPGSASPYVNRGGFIYDRLTKTDQFDGTLTVSAIEMVNFEELPLCFRQYITYEAARRFNVSYNGDPTITEEASTLSGRAWARCTEFEMDFGGYNIFNDDPYVSSANGRS